MKIKENELKNVLIEVYSYHFRQAIVKDRLRDSDNPDDAYEIGKHDGAVQAMEAIMLQVFGGEQLFEIWQKTMKWATKSQIPINDEVKPEDDEVI